MAILNAKRNNMLLSIIFLLLGYKDEVKVNNIQHEIESFYNINIDIKRADMPNMAYYKLNNRYRADKILNWLSKTYPGDTMIALTSYDISTTYGKIYDWGIFGLGSLVNNTSVTSVYRFKNKNIEDRLYKIILHEIGHSYGLPHCSSDDGCFMKSGDHTIKYIDNEEKKLCNKCKNKLNELRIKTNYNTRSRNRSIERTAH